MPDKAALLRDIEAAVGELQAALGAIDDAAWNAPSLNPGWTNRQVLAHLGRVQARQRSQLKCARELQPWWPDSADEYNARTLAERADWPVVQLRKELARETAATLALFEGLSDEDLETRFTHPVRGPETFAGVLARFAQHMRLHTAQLRLS